MPSEDDDGSCETIADNFKNGSFLRETGARITELIDLTVGDIGDRS